MGAVLIDEVRKRYGGHEVLHGITLDIADGEFVALVGPSGCGKTTLLRMIAGLEDISEGAISVAGNVVTDLPPKDRDIAMVFQTYALYPHMTVEANMGFALRLQKVEKEEKRRRVREAAAILGLEPLLDRYPRQLSGGQRQRVAMGRAIVRNSEVFLFDEPLSNLDAKLRVQMRTEIKQLHMRLKTTTVYVTHDQIEAMTMADRIVVLQRGVVEQIGTPLELYDRPANLFVAGFIGSPAMNIFPGRIRGGAFEASDGTRIGLGGPGQDAGGNESDLRSLEGREVRLGLRPEHFALAEGALSAEVITVEPTGSETHVRARMLGQEVNFSFRERVPAGPGEHLGIRPWRGGIHLFDADTGRRIAPGAASETPPETGLAASTRPVA